MADLPEYVMQKGQSCYQLLLWVQPGAKKTAIAGSYQGRLKIKLSSKPVQNRANQELLSFLAARLGLKKNNLALESGQGSRKKVVSISIMEEPDWDVLGY
ncbi:MAG: DUF167 domain-containing protein [Thermodesulfobacteriota bacterium]